MTPVAGMRKTMMRLAGVLCAVLLLTQTPAAGTTEELPLGVPGLRETRMTEEVAPGVTYTRVDRGHLSELDFWTVDVAVVPTLAEAQALEQDLEGAGHDATIVPLENAPDDPRRGPSGYVVRSGMFQSQAEADERAAELVAQGYAAARTVYSAHAGEPTTGPFVVHVLEIDADEFDGRIVPELGTEVVPGRETVTAMVQRTGARAGINAGYFVIGEQDGTPGDLAGISAIDGDLVSEAVNGRTSLLVRPGGPADVAALETHITATIGRHRLLVDGYNREPGEIRSCGGVGGDEPTERPRHDFTCRDDSELIYFTPEFGSVTAPGEGAEVALDRAGRIVEVRDGRGGAIPTDGAVLSATGQIAEELLAVADVGKKTRVRAVTTEKGRKVRIAGRLGVVNGGPRLVARGRNRITAYAEGFVWPDDPAFYYRFGVARHPRTIAGVTGDGRLLLVAIDGRHIDHSAGATFAEEAGVMRVLGATEAVNLDGGGSTTMVVDRRLVSRPSDATGERPIGDALLVFD